MSQIPIMIAMLAGQQYGHETPFSESPGWQARYGDQEVSQFRGAELIAEKWDISRDDMEEFAVESHERALRAPRRGPLRERDRPARRPARSTKGRASPTGRRSGRCRRSIPGGRLTAAVSSQISDASAALLIAGEQAVKDHGLKPRARIHHIACAPTTRLHAHAHRSRQPSTRSRKAGHDDRRHRPGRDQRGVRVGRARVAEGERGSISRR